MNRFLDNTKARSLTNKFRRKRFKLFLKLIENIPKPVNILDIGGTESFWKMMEYHRPEDVKITIINTEKIIITYPNFQFIQMDGRDLSRFKDKEFDVIFSNSVIEHVGTFIDQKKMASEIIRTGKTYFIQTPNYYFPIEPHFMFPLFQFLPGFIKIFLVTTFSLGSYRKFSNKEEAEKVISSIRLLKKNEILLLFPESKVHKEKIILLNKSFIAYRN
jgi:hypothetical protein